MPIIGVIASSAKGAPAAPVSVSATDVGTSRAYNNGAATVSFTPGAGAAATSFTATSSPGGFTATGASSPLTVTGLQSGVSYTFTVTATNASGTSDPSSASNSITATTVPQAPTVSATDVGTSRAYNNGAATVTVSGGATGGKTISSYTATSSPGSFTATSGSPLTVTGLASATSYTFSVTATNANGTSTATVTNSITATTVPQAPTIGTASQASATSVNVAFTAGANGGKTVSTFTATSSPGSITGTNSGSPVLVSGLTSGTAYTFTVTATNANGTSSASSSSNSVTPNPALSAWTQSTDYPNVDQRFPVAVGGMMSVTQAWDFYVGTGQASNNFSSTVGYFWTGSAWSQRNYGVAVYGPGIQRISSTTAVGVGGYNYGSSANVSTRVEITGATNGQVSPTYPQLSSFVGIAATSGGIRYAGREGGNQSYSQTSLASSFTSQTNYPLTNASFGIDNGSFNGNMYFFPRSQNPVYYATSLSSGWTAGATMVNPYSQNVNVFSNNTYILYMNWDPNAIYRYNTSNNTITYIGDRPAQIGNTVATFSKDNTIRSVRKYDFTSAGSHYYATYA